MKALVFERNPARFAASRVASQVVGSGKAAGISSLRLIEADEPDLPGPGWHRVRPLLSGICGSDLATVDGKTSRYFEPLVSFPFVPGHEVVGTVDSAPFGIGTRVVVEAVIGCEPRGIVPPCSACAEGRVGDCEMVAFGHLAPGLQIGYCKDTGGGWSTAGLVAHESQLHRVPDSLGDEGAVMIEPTACAVHAVLRAGIVPGELVSIIGAGTLGLLTTASVRHLSEPSSLLVGGKHRSQRLLAEQLGADLVVAPDQLARSVRQRARAMAVSERVNQLTGGADVVFDCVGSPDSVKEALSMVRPRGKVVLVGMPGNLRVDLASLWHREVSLMGAYAYGTERLRQDGSTRKTFDLATEIVASRHLGELVSARYPIDRFEEAIAHAGNAGRRGAVKIVFDLQARQTRRVTEPSGGRTR